MKFGIFDHLDRRDEPLNQFYEERLRLVEAADEFGITGYHTAEHHWNPVGMAPAPGVFLSAVAQRTKRIRFGPMGYALAFHNPLILAEEICMLDHLSDGRFDLGIGRGISPWEMQMFGVTLPESRDLFRETFEIILQCLTSERVTHRGQRYQYYDIPMELRPLQEPYPPLWYPSTSPAERDYIARHGMHLVTGWAPTARVKQAADDYREIWEQHKNDPLRAHSPAQPTIGSVRHVVIAETDTKAREIAAPARDCWYKNLEHLGNMFGHRTMFVPEDYETAARMGGVVAGSPETVRAQLAEHIELSGINYLILQLAFGDQTHADEMRTLNLFANEVMPGLT
jgi:alkanesulfonate monooxygenase SsuD/methylene tetrahydromethanopterin reductase-like flavin-dependent oxidoreductase (luciferase family)